MNHNNKKSIVIGGVIGLIIGIITCLGLNNDNFVYMYSAPYYIYWKIFDGFGDERIIISVYFGILGILIGYSYSASKFQKNRLEIISLIVFLHIVVSVIGLRAISKDMKEFLNNVPAKMIVDAISRNDN